MFDLPVAALPPTAEPVRVAARRLRWFRSAFHRFAEAQGRALGCGFEIDDRKIAAAFVRWLRALEAHQPIARDARRVFFPFAAGLMLRELVADLPLRATGAPARADADSPAAFWPEGYTATLFCLSVTAAALAQEFDEATTLAPEVDDLRHWWSFRENVAEDPMLAVPFLEMFLGQQPLWRVPGSFWGRLHRDLSPSQLPDLPS